MSDVPPLIPTSRRITSICIGEVVDPTRQFHTSTITPLVPLSSTIRIVRVKLRTLNKRFLGGNPSILLLFEKLKTKKTRVILPPPSPLALGAIGPPLPLVFLIALFIEDNESFKPGGGVSL